MRQIALALSLLPGAVAGARHLTRRLVASSPGSSQSDFTKETLRWPRGSAPAPSASAATLERFPSIGNVTSLAPARLPPEIHRTFECPPDFHLEGRKRCTRLTAVPAVLACPAGTERREVLPDGFAPGVGAAPVLDGPTASPGAWSPAAVGAADAASGSGDGSSPFTCVNRTALIGRCDSDSNFPGGAWQLSPDGTLCVLEARLKPFAVDCVLPLSPADFPPKAASAYRAFGAAGGAGAAAGGAAAGDATASDAAGDAAGGGGGFPDETPPFAMALFQVEDLIFPAGARSLWRESAHPWLGPPGPPKPPGVGGAAGSAADLPSCFDDAAIEARACELHLANGGGGGGLCLQAAAADRFVSEGAGAAADPRGGVAAAFSCPAQFKLAPAGASLACAGGLAQVYVPAVCPAGYFQSPRTGMCLRNHSSDAKWSCPRAYRMRDGVCVVQERAATLPAPETRCPRNRRPVHHSTGSTVCVREKVWSAARRCRLREQALVDGRCHTARYRRPAAVDGDATAVCDSHEALDARYNLCVTLESTAPDSTCGSGGVAVPGTNICILLDTTPAFQACPEGFQIAFGKICMPAVGARADVAPSGRGIGRPGALKTVPGESPARSEPVTLVSQPTPVRPESPAAESEPPPAASGLLSAEPEPPLALLPSPACEIGSLVAGSGTCVAVGPAATRVTADAAQWTCPPFATLDAEKTACQFTLFAAAGGDAGAAGGDGGAAGAAEAAGSDAENAVLAQDDGAGATVGDSSPASAAAPGIEPASHRTANFPPHELLLQGPSNSPSRGLPPDASAALELLLDDPDEEDEIAEVGLGVSMHLSSDLADLVPRGARQSRSARHRLSLPYDDVFEAEETLPGDTAALLPFTEDGQDVEIDVAMSGESSSEPSGDSGENLSAGSGDGLASGGNAGAAAAEAHAARLACPAGSVLGPDVLCVSRHVRVPRDACPDGFYLAGTATEASGAGVCEQILSPRLLCPPSSSEVNGTCFATVSVPARMTEIKVCTTDEPGCVDEATE